MELSTPIIALAFFLATLLGALPPVMRRWGDRSLHLFIALSAGLFLGTVFLHILPELAGLPGGDGHDHGGESGHHSNLVPWVAALAGFLGLFLLEKVWLRGYEERATDDPHRFVWLSTYIALSLHAFAAGLGLAAIQSKWVVLIPILWHKLTEAFSLTTVLRLGGIKNTHSWLLIIFFGAATPIGFLAGDSFLHAGAGLEPILIGLAGGTFIYVAACDLLPEVFHEVGRPAPRLFALVAGIFAAGMFPHHATANLGGGVFYPLVVASWDMFLAMAPYLLFGFIIAGVLNQWLDAARLSKWVAQDNLRSVVIASVIGAPLPLCSCSVVPVAASLRKAGASKGATSAFLVATPETGVDSISVTIGLLDPLMAIIRPFASVLSALITGLGVNRLVNSGKDDEPQIGIDAEVQKSCCEGDEDAGDAAEEKPQGGFIRRAMRYAFVDMLDDLAGALIVGILLSGLIVVILPDGLFAGSMLGGAGEVFLMLVVGIPLYVCAASSTPIAASLILKGMSPGAALVFLLAGPATNIATLSVMSRYLGKRTVLVHVGVLAAVTLALGFATNALYGALDITATARIASEHQGTSHYFQLAVALVFGCLLIAALWRGFVKEDEGRGHEGHSHG